MGCRKNDMSADDEEESMSADDDDDDHDDHHRGGGDEYNGSNEINNNNSNRRKSATSGGSKVTVNPAPLAMWPDLTGKLLSSRTLSFKLFLDKTSRLLIYMCVCVHGICHRPSRQENEFF